MTRPDTPPAGEFAKEMTDDARDPVVAGQGSLKDTAPPAARAPVTFRAVEKLNPQLEPFIFFGF